MSDLTVGRITQLNDRKMTAQDVLREVNRHHMKNVWKELTEKKDEEKMEQQQTIRQGIIEDAQVTIFMAALKSAPERIMAASDNLEAAEYELKLHEINELEQAKEALLQVELEIAFEVRQDENLKNEKMRDAAIAKQKKDNEEYVAAVNRLAKAKQKKAELENNIGKNRNQMFHVRNLFQAYCACAGMIAGLCHEQETNGIVEATKNLASTLSQVKEETSHA